MNVRHLCRRRLAAPQEDGAVLVEPPVEDVPELVDTNRRDRQAWRCDINGRPLADIARSARGELLAAARRWTAAYRDLDAMGEDPNRPIFLAGHQPQMFHPGVWYKNFMLGHLAATHGATAVNLIVDNDTVSDPSLRVPGGSANSPTATQIAYDLPEPKIPYEERKIADRRMFGDFDERVKAQIAPLLSEPLIMRYWPLVRARAENTDNLGACLAQARHQLEGAWGLRTLEVPQSWVCMAESFQWFVTHLLVHLPRFRAVYNEAVREYRRVHRVRSLAHPVPELAAEGPWLETPLWVWTADQPHRRRLFAQSRAGEILLSDRQTWEERLPQPGDGNAARAVDRLRELQDGGVRIRSRALLTTLWARLALGDLFVHGIGGAKYDQVTDLLIERFFGVAPPQILVVSATLHLPIEHPRASADEMRHVEGQLRELRYHPERFLDDSSDAAAEHVSIKRQWIAAPQTKENARRRCQAIRHANEALQPCLASRRARLEQIAAQVRERLEAENVLAWREYGFCLYPESLLRDFLSGLLPKTR